jgi:hypothetical protein
MKLMPSAARRLMFGVSKPRTFWIAGIPDLTDRRVVPHNVDDVGWRSVLLSKLGQLPAYVLIFGSPLGAVLRRKDVVLSVMNDFWLCLLCNSSMAGSASHK